MAGKKVKFPLDMGNDVLVRDIDELKENFNIEKVTEYFLNGKLLTWLNDRFYDEEAEQVEELSSETDKSMLAGKLCRIFEIEIESDVDIEAIERRKERLEKLRGITSDDDVLANVDHVAFSQEELGDLLDEDVDVIYLCGEKFRIPLSVKDKKYIGVNDPELTISTKNDKIDLSECGIIIERCSFSEKTIEKMVKEDKEDAKTDDFRNSADTELNEKSNVDPKAEKLIAFLHDRVDKEQDELDKKIEQNNHNYKEGTLGALLFKMSDRSIHISTYFVNWGDTGYTNSTDVMDALEKQYNEFTSNRVDILNDPEVNNIYYCKDIKTITSGCLYTRESGMLPFKGDAARISIWIPADRFEEFKKKYTTPIALTYLSERIPPNMIHNVEDGLAPVNDFHPYYIVDMPKFLRLFANDRDRRINLYDSKEGYSIQISGYERVSTRSIESIADSYMTSSLGFIDEVIVRNSKENVYDRVTELVHHYYKYDLNYDNEKEIDLHIHFCDYTSNIDVVTDTEEIKNSLIKQYNDMIKSIGDSPIVYPENINDFVSGSLVFDVYCSSYDINDNSFKMHEHPTKSYGSFSIYINPHKFAEFAQKYLTPIVYIPCRERLSDDFLCEITKAAKFNADSIRIIPGYIVNIPKLISDMTFEDQYMKGTNELCSTDCMGGTYSKEKFDNIYESVNSYKRSKKVASAIKEYNELLSNKNPLMSRFKFSIPNI